jgi:hypothetical protein
VFLAKRVLFASPRRPSLAVCRLLLRHLFQTSEFPLIVHQVKLLFRHWALSAIK